MLLECENKNHPYRWPWRLPKPPQSSIEIAGMRWGFLVARGIGTYVKGRGQRWVFMCDCGTEKEIRLSLVKAKRIDSCGCRPAPRHKRAYQIAYTFGVDRVTAHALAIRTEGVCDVCSRPERDKTRGGITRMLNVDHCHGTGNIRGILCSDCNIAIGKSGESSERLRALANYLDVRK